MISAIGLAQVASVEPGLRTSRASSQGVPTERLNGRLASEAEGPSAVGPPVMNHPAGADHMNRASIIATATAVLRKLGTLDAGVHRSGQLFASSTHCGTSTQGTSIAHQIAKRCWRHSPRPKMSSTAMRCGGIARVDASCVSTMARSEAMKIQWSPASESLPQPQRKASGFHSPTPPARLGCDAKERVREYNPKP